MATKRLSHKDLQELKHDPFAEGVGSWLQWISQHPGQVKMWGVAAIAVLIAFGGFLYYRAQQRQARSELLFTANFTADARVENDGQPVGPNMVFPTPEERDAAMVEAYTDVVETYPGSQEAAIAELYLAALAADRGDMPTAITHYRHVADTAPENYSSVAQLSLAESLAGQGNITEAEQILQELMDNPTAFVSSEQAQLTLGRLLGQTNPVRARQVLEELEEGRSLISRLAVQELAALPAVETPVTPPAEETTEQ